MSVRIRVELLTDAGGIVDTWVAYPDSDIDTVLSSVNDLIVHLHSTG